MSYPKELTPSKLKDVNTVYLAKEICNRYNAHEKLVIEVERLQFEKSLEKRSKIGFVIFSILGALTSLILLFINHA